MSRRYAAANWLPGSDLLAVVLGAQPATGLTPTMLTTLLHCMLHATEPCHVTNVLIYTIFVLTLLLLLTLLSVLKLRDLEARLLEEREEKAALAGGQALRLGC